MSTRGCVAVRQEGDGQPWNDYGLSWRGVYNHSDSYPTGLGEEVFSKVLSVPNLVDFYDAILRASNWRELETGGICEYCGKQAGQPHTISGVIFGYEGEGYPDPEAEHHQHNEGPVEDHQITCDAPGPLFIEWVYVIDPLERKLYVLAHQRVKDGRDEQAMTNSGDPVFQPEVKAWDYGHCLYRHELVGTLDLDEPTPDWEAFEDKYWKEREEA